MSADYGTAAGWVFIVLLGWGFPTIDAKTRAVEFAERFGNRAVTDQSMSEVAEWFESLGLQP